MPRVSREQVENNRRAITDASARLMREHGINGVSVSGLMSAAGLTHGGFYGHFDSKDELAAAACARAFEQALMRWKRRVAGEADAAAALQALVEGYLSKRSRDSPGTSCPASALVGDVAREVPDAAVRGAYLAGVKDLLHILRSLQESGDAESDRRRSLTLLATLVGALQLARATVGDPISEEFLSAARESLAQRSPSTPPPRPAPRARD